MNSNSGSFTISLQQEGLCDRFFAFLFALLPIVQPIMSPLPITWSMFFLILAVPYLSFKIIKKRVISLNYVWPISIYAIYKIFNHGTDITELLIMLFLIMLVVALVNDCITVEVFNQYVKKILIIATFCVLLQNIAHYLLNQHIVFLPPNWLRTEELQLSYYDQLRTGIAGKSAMYRPSAFFIEPSIMALYSLPALFYCLLSSKADNHNKKIALFITAGIVLTTSGMGIFYSVIIWGYYFLKKAVNKGRFNLKWLILSNLAVVLFGIGVFTVPIIRDAVLRIFFASGGANSAIIGRLGSGQYYFEQLILTEKLFGAGNSVRDYALYLSGMYAIIVDSGIVGYVVFCNIFFQLGRSIKNVYSILAFMLIGISVISNIALIQLEVFFLISVMFGLYENCNVKSC